LLHKLGWSVQKPEQRARERDFVMWMERWNLLRHRGGSGALERAAYSNNIFPSLLDQGDPGHVTRLQRLLQPSE